MPNSTHHSHDALLDRRGLLLASYLHLGTQQLPHDVSERLRVARLQALASRKQAKPQTVQEVAAEHSAGALAWGSDDRLGWWGRIGSAVPLIALVAGLLLIHSFQNEFRAQELAEVDGALLTDELPPAAFADPGFLQFLKSEQ